MKTPQKLKIKNYLSGALSRARDFKEPALPKTIPGLDQDLPALPPSRPSALLSAGDQALRRATDWRQHKIWNWISGGGLKGLLGARRFWATALRYSADGLGKIAWTFRLAVILPMKYSTSQAAKMSSSIRDFRRSRDAGRLRRPPAKVIRRVFLHGVVPPMAGGVAFIVGAWVFAGEIPQGLYFLAAIAGIVAIFLPLVSPVDSKPATAGRFKPSQCDG